jgi:aspartate dehydrogenase
MSRLVKIGIVGCGAIGSSLAKAITRDFSKMAKLSALYDIDAEKAKSLSRKVSGSAKLAASSLKDVISKSDLVIEAASAKYSAEIAVRVLNSGKDCMVMSVGGIIGPFARLKKLAQINNARIYIPSGAISGIDALKAAQLGKIKSVTLTTRKSPRSFKGVDYVQQKGIALDKIKDEKLLFSGSAKQAVKYFPQNINVAAILSLAGLGPLKYNHSHRECFASG